MYVNNTLSHHRREDITDPKLEILGIEVTPKHAKAFVILCWYRPPTSDIDNCSFEALAKIIRKIDAESKEIILIGDTNCDFKSPKDGNSRKLKLIYSEFQFEQKLQNTLGLPPTLTPRGRLRSQNLLLITTLQIARTIFLIVG